MVMMVDSMNTQNRKFYLIYSGIFIEFNSMDPSGIPHNRGSRASLTASLRDGNDTDSMTDYGEDDSSKFGEDGSFIGQYGSKKRNAEPQSPTGMATFV